MTPCRSRPRDGIFRSVIQNYQQIPVHINTFTSNLSHRPSRYPVRDETLMLDLASAHDTKEFQ